MNTVLIDVNCTVVAGNRRQLQCIFRETIHAKHDISDTSSHSHSCYTCSHSQYIKANNNTYRKYHRAEKQNNGVNHATAVYFYLNKEVVT